MIGKLGACLRERVAEMLALGAYAHRGCELAAGRRGVLSP
jgi:hypothetical protein